jgi:hypothetical protein
MRRRIPVRLVLAAGVLGAVLAASGRFGSVAAVANRTPTVAQDPAGRQEAGRLPAARSIAARVTAVTGVSWLGHLGIDFDRTSMGRMGQNTPPPSIKYEPRWNQLAGTEDAARRRRSIR